MPGLDAVSFLYGQVLTQIEYLHEQGHLSQQNYATIVGALMQASPPASPAVPNHAFASSILSTPVSSEPSPYAAGPSSASLSSSARPALTDSPKPARSSSSFLKFKSKSSDEKKPNAPSPLPPATGSVTVTSKPRAEDEEEDLGKINKNIRRALQGGWILGSVVDQALAVTPFVPEAFRERIVETVEETSGEWVTKLTSPQRQAIVRNNLTRTGSTALQLAKGGGGTSRASSMPSVASASSASKLPVALANAETGTYSLIQSAAGQKPGDAAVSMTSVHSFVANEDVQITTVVTASILPKNPAKEASSISRQAGLSPEAVDPHDEVSVSRYSDSGSAARDPSIVTGHVW